MAISATEQTTADVIAGSLANPKVGGQGDLKPPYTDIINAAIADAAAWFAANVGDDTDTYADAALAGIRANPLFTGMSTTGAVALAYAVGAAVKALNNGAAVEYQKAAVLGVISNPQAFNDTIGMSPVIDSISTLMDSLIP